PCPPTYTLFPYTTLFRSTRKLKIGRSLGVNLWGQAKSPFNKRKYKPGQHGPTSRGGNSSDYAKQMRAKQTLKGYYGNVGEKKFRDRKSTRLNSSHVSISY